MVFREGPSKHTAFISHFGLLISLIEWEMSHSTTGSCWIFNSHWLFSGLLQSSSSEAEAYPLCLLFLSHLYQDCGWQLHHGPPRHTGMSLFSTLQCRWACAEHQGTAHIHRKAVTHKVYLHLYFKSRDEYGVCTAPPPLPIPCRRFDVHLPSPVPDTRLLLEKVERTITKCVPAEADTASGLLSASRSLCTQCLCSQTVPGQLNVLDPSIWNTTARPPLLTSSPSGWRQFTAGQMASSSSESSCSENDMSEGSKWLSLERCISKRRSRSLSSLLVQTSFEWFSFSFFFLGVLIFFTLALFSSQKLSLSKRRFSFLSM